MTQLLDSVSGVSPFASVDVNKSSAAASCSPDVIFVEMCRNAKEAVILPFNKSAELLFKSMSMCFSRIGAILFVHSPHNRRN